MLEFNKGAYGYIIAKDKSGTFGEHDEEDEEEEVIKENEDKVSEEQEDECQSRLNLSWLYLFTGYPQLLQRRKNP